MGKALRLEDFSRRRCKVTLSLTERLGITDVKERHDEFVSFLTRERSRHIMKVLEMNRIMDTISKEWGIELPLPDPAPR